MGRIDQQRRLPRLAEDIAEVLRGRILDGVIPDGAVLSKQEDLAAEFRVSLPSVREALRLLESEGLVTVQRGKIGGSIVHVPQASKVAYMLGLVLESRHVGVDELVAAIAQVEPLCVRSAAERPDRMTVVVEPLEALQRESEGLVREASRFARVARQFHEQMIASCGNEPLIVLVGAMEALWWGQVRTAGDEIEFGALPEVRMRERSIAEHRRLIDLISAGDADGAERAAREHQGEPQRHRLIGREFRVSAAPLREG